MKQQFHVRVSQAKYEEYPCFSFYEIEAEDYHEAERKAEVQFSNDFGFERKDLKAWTFDKNPSPTINN